MWVSDFMFPIWNSLLFPVGTSSLARSTFPPLALERGIQVSVCAYTDPTGISTAATDKLTEEISQ